jgi:hypothetical protein
LIRFLEEEVSAPEEAADVATPSSTTSADNPEKIVKKVQTQSADLAFYFPVLFLTDASFVCLTARQSSCEEHRKKVSVGDYAVHGRPGQRDC